MLFSSIPFIYYFLPCTLLCYYLIPFQYKNFILLLFSLLFYSWGEPIYVIFMVLSIVFGYIEGILIEKQKSRKKAFWTTIFACMFHLAFLLYFKYSNFLIELLQTIGISLNTIHVALPLGISFYTFQIISYLMDIYQQKCSAQKNIISFGTYVSLFPQLIAGPIVRYIDIEKQLKQRTCTMSQMAYGIQRFIIGLAKKVLLANTLGELCQVFQMTSDPSVLYYWLYAIALTLQIYFDFSGYSDMAIGLGNLFGFHFLENFNYPLISKSIQEFWRRWHISLGSWFRDYVYIPLGGNRVPKIRWIFNVLIVWSLTGLWHGAAWNFILWGMMFAFFLMLEKTKFSSLLKRHHILAHLYVVLVILISFVVFDAKDINDALHSIHIMFTGENLPLISKEFSYYLQSYGIVLIAALIGATPLLKNLLYAIKKNTLIHKFFLIIKPVALIFILIIITTCLINDSYNPFLYFRF